MSAVTELIQSIYFLLLILVVIGLQNTNICNFMVIILKAMAISKGIFINAFIVAHQIRSFVSASFNSLVTAKAAPSCKVPSPLVTIPQPNTVPATRVRRVRFCNEVRLRTFNPSSPPDGVTRTRADYLFEALAKARAAEAKVAEAKTLTARHTTPPTRSATIRPDVPAKLRVVISNRVRVQEYQPGEAPEHVRSSSHRSRVAYMSK
ncbi:hypothetical protein FRC03_009759 [Tulasnella sp. 419]|nr:hypothetical protein FRC03_009759 [Tulasnella sp. 419]